MTTRWPRTLALTMLLPLTQGSSGCGYLLHPERRGAQSGQIDSTTMVMDLLWLLPGIVPGVIALVVDFSSGAIYVRGGHALRLVPGGHLAVRLPRTRQPDRLELRLVTASRHVLARQVALVGPDAPNTQVVALDARGPAGTSEPVYLEVQSDNAGRAHLDAPIALTFLE